MLRYLARRLGFLVVSFAVAMIVIFVLLRLLPGDPANALLSVNATPEQIAAAQEQVGSNLPLVSQFTLWAGQIIRFDFGTSLISQLPVGPEIASRLVVTLPLTVLAFLLATVLALVIGITAAVKADRWYGTLLSGFAQLGIAVPTFWVGILLVWCFALGLGWLPSGGFPRGDWQHPGEALTSLALPILTIAIVMSASLARYVRTATLDVLGSDYLRTARA
ncbi:ABC transporter permease, partial [Leucobacter sp. M11]|uniref:ABC transporter permease n=1 Tax=Leucobacter sp. M11 TaxID=2993565 RepID=UPI002D7E7F53